MKALRTTLISAAVFCPIFAACGLITNWGEWDKLSAYAIIGLVIGLLAAPELSPKSFDSPVMWQSFWGGVCAMLIALFLDADLRSVALATVVGTVIGMTANLWLKYVPWP